MLSGQPIDRHENATAKLGIGVSEYIFYFAERNSGAVLRYDIDADTWASSDDAGAAGHRRSNRLPSASVACTTEGCNEISDECTHSPNDLSCADDDL